MTPLVQYVLDHTARNQCRCGVCADKGEEKPGAFFLTHTVDMFFFDVCVQNNPDAETFKTLIREHEGSFGDMDPLDNKEHSYIEVGGWIGDQGIGMQCMALGKILGLWEIMQPTLIGLKREDPLAQQMAGMGMVSIVPGRKTS